MLEIKKLLADFKNGIPLDRSEEIQKLAEEIISQPPSDETDEQWAERLAAAFAEYDD